MARMIEFFGRLLEPNNVWPWLVVLIVAGLVAVAVVLWQSEAFRLIWGNVWELLRSRRG